MSSVQVVDWAKSNAIDFVVVGPEDPLTAGVVDELEKAGILAFGPNKAAAELEGSKAFMKDILQKYNVMRDACLCSNESRCVPGVEIRSIEDMTLLSVARDARNQVPTATYIRTTSADDAKAYITKTGAPIVVKASGLCAGKGVIICESVEEGHKAVDDMMGDKIFGASGDEVSPPGLLARSLARSRLVFSFTLALWRLVLERSFRV
jgi:phosphoribosylamine--glycine ligase